MLELVGGNAVFELHSMCFQHVAQPGQRFLRLRRNAIRPLAAAALNNVAAARAAHVHKVRLLEFLDEIREASSAISALAEGRIKLEHRGFEQAKLRLHGAALENLERA